MFSFKRLNTPMTKRGAQLGSGRPPHGLPLGSCLHSERRLSQDDPSVPSLVSTCFPEPQGSNAADKEGPL